MITRIDKDKRTIILGMVQDLKLCGIFRIIFIIFLLSLFQKY